MVVPVAVSERVRRGRQRSERMRLPVEVLGAEALSAPRVKNARSKRHFRAELLRGLHGVGLKLIRCCTSKRPSRCSARSTE